MIASGTDAIIDSGKLFLGAMIVNDKYRLGALVRTGEIATFEAQEVGTGQVYYIHLMSGGSAPSTDVLTSQVRTRLAAASADPASPLIDQGDYEGAPFVVTEAKPELLDLKRWIEAQSPSAPPEAGSEASTHSGEGGRPGEFTRMFEAGQKSGSLAAETREGPGTQPETPRGAPPESASGSEPGEFTKMFASGGEETAEGPSQDVAPPKAAPEPAAERPASQPPPPRTTEPVSQGSFTKMFQQGPGPGSPGSADRGQDLPGRDPAAPQVRTGEGSVERASGPPPPAADKRPGEFTRLFEQGASVDRGEQAPPPPMPEPQPKQAAPADAPSPGPPAEPAKPTPPATQPAAPGGGQPGDFTAMFRLRPEAPEKEAPKPEPPPRSGEPTITESGLRRLSPEERREEMRQFRMVSREGAPQQPPEAHQPAAPAHPASQAPAAPPAPPRAPAAPPAPPQAPAGPPAQPGTGSGQPGEFTRLFQGGGPAAGEPTAAPPAPPPARPPAGATPDRPSATQLGGPGSAPPAPPQQQSGEFTRMFQPGKAGPAAPPGAPAGAPPPGPPPGAPAWPQQATGEPGPQGPGRAGQTGEFTKLFREAKPASRTAEPSLAPPTPASSGEFTRLFGSGGGAPPSDPWKGPSQAPPSREPSGGDFTKMFGGSGGSGSPGGDPFPRQSGGGGQDPFSSGPSGGLDPGSPPPEPAEQQGDFTRLFGGRPGQKPAGAGRWGDAGVGAESATQISRKPAPPPEAPPPAQGPSDYTRMMGSGPGLPRQQAPGGPQSAPPQGAAPQYPAPQYPEPPPAAPQYPAPPTPPAAAPPAAPPAYAPPAYAPPAAPAAAPPPVAPQPPAPQPQPASRDRDRESSGGSDRSMYLIFALVFCALLVVALGVVLFVSLTSDSPDPAAAPAEEEQSGAQAPGGNLPTGLNPSVRAPSVTSPSVQAPTATAPSVSGSGVSSGSLSAPSVTAPSVSAPSVSTPSVSTPRLPSGQIPSATAAPQASTQASESSGTPFLALIIILSVLLVIAVGAAVYFALRRA